MKLAYKTILYFILSTVPLLIIAFLVTYQLIYAELKDGADEALHIEVHNIKEKIKTDSLNIQPFFMNDNLGYVKLVLSAPYKKRKFDTLIFNAHEKEKIPYRVLDSYFEQNGKFYNIRLYKSIIEIDELAEAIFIAVTVLILSLIILILVINFMLSKKLWKPFYEELETIKAFNLNANLVENAHKPSHNIIEFNLLSSNVIKMKNRIVEQYSAQKQFTENASHELQTPLAIINNQINNLLQSSHLTEKELQSIQVIEQTLKRISNINKSLLLLSKIENRHFTEKTEVNFTKILNIVLAYLNDWAAYKEIEIESKIDSDFLINANTYLIEILLSNLISNAIKHNINGGKINIQSAENKFIISNTGYEPQQDVSQCFNRFTKSSPTDDSPGLGLSIAKSICEAYNIDIGYKFSKIHIIELLK